MKLASLYVNPITGNDSNNGSQLNPFKTITRALKTIPSPGIIRLSEGTYSTQTREIFPLVIPQGVVLLGNESKKGEGIIITGGGEYQSPSFGLQNITLLFSGDGSILGITVTNSVSKGTGIWIESAAPTLANNTLCKCGREGILSTGQAKPAILDNVFIQNIASGLMMARSSKGEVLRNVFENNPVGIAITDLAAPLIANNKLGKNQIGMAISRDASPVLRGNLIYQNSQSGLSINGNAIPDLGKPQDPAGNIFREQEKFRCSK